MVGVSGAGPGCFKNGKELSDFCPYNWGSVRKMRIYNAKEVPIIKKADFQSLKESTF